MELKDIRRNTNGYTYVDIEASGKRNFFVGQFREWSVLSRTATVSNLAPSDVADLEAGRLTLEELLGQDSDDPSQYRPEERCRVALHPGEGQTVGVSSFQEVAPYISQRNAHHEFVDSSV